MGELLVLLACDACVGEVDVVLAVCDVIIMSAPFGRTCCDVSLHGSVSALK